MRGARGPSWLAVQVGIVILCAPIVGYGAAGLARAGGIVVCAIVGILLVTPAVLALGSADEPKWLLALWITLLPSAMMAGGRWQERSRARR